MLQLIDFAVVFLEVRLVFFNFFLKLGQPILVSLLCRLFDGFELPNDVLLRFFFLELFFSILFILLMMDSPKVDVLLVFICVEIP